MWNFYSLSAWIYEVPYLTEYKIFEMPVLGYSGYITFGIECGVIVKLFFEDEPFNEKTDY